MNQKHKWLGGAVTPAGDIIGIPSHAPSVIRITPGEEPRIEFHGEGQLNNMRKGSRLRFKWLRGMVVGDAIYGIPAWADSVVKVCLNSWSVSTFGEEELRPLALSADALREASRKEKATKRREQRFEETEVDVESGAEEDTAALGWRWMWHGAALADDGKTIYAIPACADRVLRVDTSTGEVRRVGPRMPGMQKWYGGIKGAPGSDGAVYGVPYGAPHLLKINPAAAAEDVTVEHVHVESRGGDDALPDGDRWRWHGGARSDLNGAIYCYPAHAEHVLKIDTLAGGATSQLGCAEDADPIVVESMKGRYKWLGEYPSSAAAARHAWKAPSLSFFLPSFLSLLYVVRFFRMSDDYKNLFLKFET